MPTFDIGQYASWRVEVSCFSKSLAAVHRLSWQSNSDCRLATQNLEYRYVFQYRSSIPRFRDSAPRSRFLNPQASSAVAPLLQLPVV